MPLLIDAYNVLHVVGALPPALAGLDALGLARLISAHGLRAGGSAILVCDGGRSGAGETRGGVAPGVELIYAGAGAEADAVLERLIAEDTAPRRLLVVSSDRRVQRAAKRRGAGVEGSEQYLRSIVARMRKGVPQPHDGANALRAQVPLDVYSTAGWMKAFGYDAGDLISRAGRAAPHPSSHVPTAPDQSRRDHQSRKTKPPSRAAEPPAAPDDALLAEALRAWDGRLSLDDLDMNRWINGVKRL